VARPRGFIVLYRVHKGTDRAAMTRFLRELRGYEDRSHYGEYVYRRAGLLDRFPHVKLIRGALIVRREDAEDLVKFLERYAEVHVREVFLNEEDERALGLR